MLFPKLIGNKMATAIEPTPILKGNDAKRFIELTLNAQRNPDPEKAKFLQECVLLYAKHSF